MPGVDKDDQGDFICGAVRNPSYEYPFVSQSVTAGQSLLIAWAPFMFLFIFNIIFWNIPYLRQKYIPSQIEPNLRINTSLLRWCDVTLRCLLYISGMTTFIGHILKFVIGLPRPNAYSLLDDPDASMVSFVSGHLAIGYTNCFIFGLWCQKSIQYSMKQNFRLPYENIDDKFDNDDEQEQKGVGKCKFNGNYWFLLPLWNMLCYVPTLSIVIAWFPIVGATFIGVTRITEYWHNEVDCVAGALVGIACAYYFGYLRYYYEIYGVIVTENQQTKKAKNKQNPNPNQQESLGEKVFVEPCVLSNNAHIETDGTIRTFSEGKKTVHDADSESESVAAQYDL